MPSKKIYFLLFFCAIVVCIIIISSSIKNRKEPLGNSSAVLKVEISQELQKANKDTDGDGLLDWEENLHGTNVENKDTDEDGIDDKTELASNHDPLIKGPNDILKGVGAETSYKTTMETDPNSLTSQTAINLISKFAELKNSGADTEENITSLVQGLTNDVSNQAKISNRYTLSQFQLLYDRDKDKIKEYVNNITRIELEEYVEVNNSEDPNDLNNSLDAFKNISARFLYVLVPSDLAVTHLNLANSFDKLALVLKTLVNYKDDPIKAVVAMQEYNRLRIELMNAHKEILNYIDSNGIIFSEKELGGLLKNVYVLYDIKS